MYAIVSAYVSYLCLRADRFSPIKCIKRNELSSSWVQKLTVQSAVTS